MTRFNPLRLSASALALAAVAAFSVGCDSGTTTPGTDAGHTDGDGHDHGSEEHAIGTVTVEGRSVTVKVNGELEAGKAYPHCHLVVNGEPVDSMRIWIGDEHGEDALRGAVQGLGSHPIVDLETPADLEGAYLGVEIVVDGETHTSAIELHHDEDGHDHGEHDEHDDHDHGDGGDHDHDGDGHPDH